MLLSKNRKAYHDNQILDKYVAGIVLAGYEVKAIREGKSSFEGSYILVKNDKPVLVNLYIGRYSNQSQPFNEQEARRDRTLLLSASEVGKIVRDISEKGITCIPLAFILEHNLVKLELATVKGLKKFEKRHVEKEKQIKKDMGM